MPRTNSEVTADLNVAQLHPPSLVAGGGSIVHVMLRFNGVNGTPTAIRQALESQFGAGKVTSDRDVMARGVYQFTINP